MSSPAVVTPARSGLGYVMRKLPHVTLLFWVLKIVAVTLGETAGDLLGITLKVGYVVTALIFLAFFLVVVVAQVSTERFRSALFWSVVLGTSMVGTEISDFLNRGVGHGSRSLLEVLVGQRQDRLLPGLRHKTAGSRRTDR